MLEAVLSTLEAAWSIKVQQLRRILRTYGKTSAMEERLPIQRGVPTAAYFRQAHVAGAPDGVYHLAEHGTSNSAKMVDRCLQFIRLTEYIL